MRGFHARPLLLAALLGSAALAGASVAHANEAGEVATLPQVLPRPQEMHLTGGILQTGTRARLVTRGTVDEATLQLVRKALARIGITRVRSARHYSARRRETQVVLGVDGDDELARALATAGGEMPDKAEGYALASRQRPGNSALIVLGGQDGDGLYYAAQSLSQIAARGTLPALGVTDYPDMAVRGTIEGFYGAPWSFADRMADLAFLGTLKANTYIYSPKDDPHARDKWREPYPDTEFAQLRRLIDEAARHHVRFTYALSPGLSMCYSDPEDITAIERKFDRFVQAGVSSFYIAYDDIPYDKWNCKSDGARFGDPGPQAAGRAQAQLTNTINAWLKARSGVKAELMIVPTEYYDAKKSPYKTALQSVDPEVFIQWTGTDVVPPSIGVRDAKAAQEAFGRKTLLWDNYPVNDYGEATGRLLMGAYRGREAGLSKELSGILANPMNQETASRVAVTGSAAFSWNDGDYVPGETSLFAARALAGGDGATTQALLLLFDLENLAPTFGSQPWQPQAPVLARQLDAIRDALARSDRAGRSAAVARLAEIAGRIEAAPLIIREGVRDPRFLTETAPWLEAMTLWGQALGKSADGLAAALAGHSEAAPRYAEAKALAEQAAAIQTLPGTTRPQGAIRLGDGVLDRFIGDAPGLVYTAPTAD